MSMELDRGQRREPLLAYAVVGIAVLYAAFTLGLEVLSWRLNIEFDIPAWRTDSPVEICLALIVIGGLIFAVTQVYRHRRDAALRLGWSYATVAMALIATSEMADWFNETAPFWSEDFWFETPLWLIAAWCLHQCIRLYAARPRYWFRAGFALQVASAVLDLLKNEIGRLPLVSPEALEVAVEYSALLCVLCYVLSLALTRVGPRTAGWSDRLTGGARLAVAALGVQAPRATQPVAVGALARRLYVDRHMFRAARYPTRYPVLHRAGLRQAVNVAMAAFFGSRIGPRIEQAAGRSLAGQFVDLLHMAVGQGIDAVSYYLFELYRPGGSREAPYYLTRYETKNGLLTVLNAARARLADVPHDLTDKAAFGEACRQAGIPTPPILLSAVDGKIDRHVPVTDFDRDLFAKLKRGRGTMQTGQYRRFAYLRYVDRDGLNLSLDEVIDNLRRQSLTVVAGKTTPVIIQPRLRNHASLADLAQDSLVVIRVVTCLDHDDVPQVTHAMLRILAKIEPEWDTLPDWEFGAAIDIETGRLGPLTGDKPDTCLTWYDSHPVTGAPVLGRQIHDWPALRDLALRAHALFRNRIVVGWDLALTTEGPMVIEGNSNMDVSFIQRAYRQPIGRSRLGELLGYHLSRL